MLSQCDRLKGIAKELDAINAALLSTRLEALVVEAGELRSKFKAATTAAGKQQRRQLSRQPGQRVQRPLYPSRKKNAARGGGGDGSGGGEAAEAGEGGEEAGADGAEEGAEPPSIEEEALSDDSSIGGEAAPSTFAAVRGSGRPRTGVRGWEGLVRSSKMGGKRLRRQ